MKARTIRPGLSWLGAIDWDRTLFDALIPLPDGTSYNAYLVEGASATALLDTVDASMGDAFLRQLDAVPRVDYVVSHHAEQDHSGMLPAVLDRYPAARLLCSPRAARVLPELLPLPADRIETVEDGRRVDLGGKTLRFVSIPWSHWPETMATWVEEDRALFPCDLFGSHLATSDLFSTDRARVLDAARLYYAQIMMPYAASIAKNLDKVAALEPALIGPSHGPVHADPGFVLDAYEDWVRGPPRHRVVIPHVSMHGSTAAMVDRLVEELVARGVGVDLHDLTALRLDRLAAALVDAATVVIAAPAVWNSIHPQAVAAAYVMNGVKPKTRFVTCIGSYGWGSKGLETLRSLLPDLKAEFLDAVFARGAPRADTYASLAALADTIAARHAAAGLAGEPAGS